MKQLSKSATPVIGAYFKDRSKAEKFLASKEIGKYNLIEIEDAFMVVAKRQIALSPTK